MDSFLRCARGAHVGACALGPWHAFSISPGSAHGLWGPAFPEVGFAAALSGALRLRIRSLKRRGVGASLPIRSLLLHGCGWAARLRRHLAFRRVWRRPCTTAGPRDGHTVLNLVALLDAVVPLVLGTPPRRAAGVPSYQALVQHSSRYRAVLYALRTARHGHAPSIRLEPHGAARPVRHRLLPCRAGSIAFAWALSRPPLALLLFGPPPSHPRLHSRRLLGWYSWYHCV